MQETRRIRDLVEWEIVLPVDHLHSVLKDLQKSEQWQLALPDLLQEFSGLLLDALELMHELGDIDARSDYSYIHHPSIAEHADNNHPRHWTALIDLTRDAWLATSREKPEQARRTAESWWQIPYALFKRLALFAAAQDSAIKPSQAIRWLVSDDCWWLWSVETEREVIRLIAGLAPRIDGDNSAVLERAILNGPPRQMFRQDLGVEDWQRRVDREVWFRLKNIQLSGGFLSEEGIARLQYLSEVYKEWKLDPDKSDEFPYALAGKSDAPAQSSPAPTKRREIAKWLEENPSPGRYEDEWRLRCQDNFVSALFAMIQLSLDGKWPIDRWREALQTWREDKFKRSWRYLAPIIAKAPDDVILKLKTQLSSWMEAHAKNLKHHDVLFFRLCNRLLDLQRDEQLEASDDPVGRAINHPVGQSTEALLRWWYGHEPKEGQGLRLDLRRLFSKMCDTSIPIFRHGRVVLAAHAVALFRVDEHWVKTDLLPLLDWNRSQEEARAAWEGFLWSPRLYPPLLNVIKKPMLESAKYYSRLGRHAEQFAGFLTFAALNPGKTFSSNELALATGFLPLQGLEQVAETLVRAMESAGSQHQEYWHNRIRPYLRAIWPKSRDIISSSISESFARLCVASHEAFPEAFEELQHWLKPVTYPDFVVSRFAESSLCKQFPVVALAFLDIVVGDQSQWLPSELRECLDQIQQAKPKLTSDRKYIRLAELFRRSEH